MDAASVRPLASFPRSSLLRTLAAPSTHASPARRFEDRPRVILQHTSATNSCCDPGSAVLVDGAHAGRVSPRNQDLHECHALARDHVTGCAPLIWQRRESDEVAYSESSWAHGGSTWSGRLRGLRLLSFDARTTEPTLGASKRDVRPHCVTTIRADTTRRAVAMSPRQYENGGGTQERDRYCNADDDAIGQACGLACEESEPRVAPRHASRIRGRSKARAPTKDPRVRPKFVL